MSEIDPYAPPRADPQPREKRSRRQRAFDSERRPVALVLLFTIVSLGLYASIWYIRRTPFVNGLKSDKYLPPALPWAMLVVELLVFVAAMAADATGVDVSSPLSLSAGILAIIIRFRIAHMLRSHFARSGMMMGVSGLATFFLGILYLQWVINDAADAVSYLPRKKKRRRKKPALEVAI